MPSISAARSTIACVLVTISGAWLAGQQAPPEPPPAVFRAATGVVQVDVAVLDGRRLPVRDLTAADFTILEDGQPRSIETFAFVDLPPRVTSPDAAWMTEVPTDVATNRSIAQDGRLLVILMDRTIPVGMPSTTAREIAVAAVNELGPNDMAALISTSGGIPQNFTSDRQRLLRAIDQRDWSSGTSSEAREMDEAKFPDGLFTTLTDGRCLCGLCVPETITSVATALQDVPRRRKSLLFIGSDFVVQAGPQLQQAELGCGQKLEDAREKMFAALDRSGVTVHGIDPSGLNTIGPTSQASSTLGGGRAALARGRAVEQNLQSQNNLHVVPDRTGGRTVVNTNAPQARVPDIVRESQSYYLIGFRPSDPDRTRPVRSIDVRVNRRNVDVRARREFSIADSSPDAGTAPVDPLGSSVESLLPRGTLPLDLQVSAFATPGSARPTVAVAVGIDAFAPRSDASVGETPLDVVVIALDAGGRQVARARQTLELNWPRSGPEAIPRVEALTRLALDPGDYEIRVAVENRQAQQVASVFSYLTVPAFASTRFALSSIVIGATPPTSSVPRDSLQGLLPIAPTTKRLFRRGESATAFMRIYQGTTREEQLEPVAVRVRIVDGQNRSVRDEVLTLAPDSFARERSADCRILIPVAQLAPGNYLLQIEGAMGERVAGRAMRFSVE